ncbi:MAG: DUF255 domain-containing protein [Planctomycetaceae bacterium]|nr:DUF255 domain-containing protein [Planctomycetaceae bacterium]
MKNIYIGESHTNTFSKITTAAVKSFAVMLFLGAIFLLACQQLSAQTTESIKWNNDIKKACQTARLENRLVLVHFCSDCAPCISMDANVFTDPRIAIEVNRNFVAVRADMRTQSLLAQQYEVTVVPTDLIIRPDEQVVYRRQGEITAEKYLQFLQFLRNNFFQSQPQSQHLTTTTPNNNTVNESAAIAAGSVLPNSTNTQPDQNLAPNTNPHSGFAFITNRPNNQPAFTPNTTDQQNIISVSGRSEPNGTVNANVVAAPSVNAGVAAANGAPLAAVVVADKNVVDGVGLGNVNGNASNPNNPSNPNTNITATPPNATVAQPNNSGTNAISATNNPMPLRDPVVGNQSGIGNIDSSGHFMVEVPLAIEGYCPVVLCKKEEWVPGNPAYYAMYRGQVYRFSNMEAMEEFLKSPLKFAPVAMGEDVVMMIDRNKKVCGLRKFGVWFGGRVYLFANKESLNNFIAKPEYYANIAQNYEAAFKSPLDTVQR